MLIRLNEYGKMLLIEGLISTGKVEFNKLMRIFKEIAPSSIIQMMNGSVILGYDHVLFAVLNALKATNNNRMICDEAALEILVYASAQRQIKNSVEMLGVKEDTKHLILAAISESQTELERLKETISEIKDLTLDSSFLNSCDDEKLSWTKKIFRISAAELQSIRRVTFSEREALERLVVERIALLAVNV